MRFSDRDQAGQLLGQHLVASGLAGQVDLVLGIPRGGVVVARGVATALGAALGLIIAAKIGAPANPELAIGATTSEGHTLWNQDLVRHLDLDQTLLEGLESAAQRQVRSRMREYLAGSDPSLRVEGRRLVVVDDGIATGFTMRAALRSLRDGGAARVSLAVPVAPADTLERLSAEVDEVFCLHSPRDFVAVGMFYRIFDQVDDHQVKTILSPGG